MKQQIGLATLEILVCLSIAIPVLFALVLSLHQSVNALALATGQHQKAIDVARISSMLQWVLNDFDSHRFLINPRIHHNGAITYSDGSPSPLMKTGVHGPTADSDGVTGLKLSIDNTLMVRSNVLIGSTLKLFACPRFGLKSTPELSCLMGIHSLGFAELKAEKVSKPDKNGCRTLLAISEAINVQAISMLVPIERHYTLYVDRHNQLRYVSHCADKILENQPVLSNIKELKLALDAVGQAPALQLSAIITLADKMAVRLAITNHLARTAIFTFLLNRP
jgi:hypothetical protein